MSIVASLSSLASGHATTPLTLLAKSEFEPWLQQQPAAKDWLEASHYSGTGTALIPQPQGGCLALYVCESLDDPFACGELSASLPATDYVLTEDASAERLLNIAFGWGVGAYRFTRYKENSKPQARLLLDDAGLVDKANQQIDAINLVRDLVNTPAQDMMPAQLSEVTRSLAEEFGGRFEEIVGDDLLTQNYPMIHAVGRASVHSPRLLDVRWGNPDSPAVTLVGKGVCFDSGGLNLKPGNYMRQMKKDMGGAAHVLGLARMIMSSGLDIHLRVLIPAVENAVSGNAFRPGDILPTRKGLTVEIDNTDAEGRLVLCDALAEAESEQPELIIDFATLTGACRVALGTELPGFFCNNRRVALALAEAGEAAAEPVWQLPLHKPYFEFMKSDIADLVNGAASPYGGAITAALYLEAFIDTTPWVHFDIMAWNLRKLPGRPVGGEAMGVRAVYQYLSDCYS
tara:strand:- start:18045 stop:19415 length:1371 start_codon:yes stop_codon:yes gene_type:complete